MPRILIAFASHYGQTHKISSRIAERLRLAHHEVELANACAGPNAVPPPADYDVVVLGSRIELGTHAPPLRSYIEVNRVALTKLPTAFFSVSMSASDAGAGADPEGYMASMFAKLHWTPTLARAFAGGLPYRKYGLVTRFIMKQISRRAHHPTDTSRDHELTNWAAVDAFADEILRLADSQRMYERTIPAPLLSV